MLRCISYTCSHWRAWCRTTGLLPASISSSVSALSPTCSVLVGDVRAVAPGAHGAGCAGARPGCLERLVGQPGYTRERTTRAASLNRISCMSSASETTRTGDDGVKGLATSARRSSAANSSAPVRVLAAITVRQRQSPSLCCTRNATSETSDSTPGTPVTSDGTRRRTPARERHGERAVKRWRRTATRDVPGRSPSPGEHGAGPDAYRRSWRRGVRQAPGGAQSGSAVRRPAFRFPGPFGVRPHARCVANASRGPFGV